LQTVDLSTIGVHIPWDDAAAMLGQQLARRLAP
ncbi:MAG: lipoyl(octanoyl) transferase, partial [Diaphorobacter nitroreducens]